MGLRCHGVRSTARRQGLLSTLLGLQLCGVVVAESADLFSVRRCFRSGGAMDTVNVKTLHASVPSQALPELILQWDPWTTSRITTSIAAIILSEKMGFTVSLRSGTSGSSMYEELATGKLHLAFETWPFSNPVAHQKYARDFESRSEADETGQVRAYKYSNLFGRSGIFETAKYDAAPLLQDALKGHSGQAHFAQEAFDQPELGEWDGSPLCAGGNCSVQILHIAPQGFDEGQVEALVQTLGIPATVAYLGQTAHTDAIWSAVTKGTGALVYSYVPNINQYGISVDDLERAKIPPRLDFKSQPLTKLAWPGLHKNFGGDALAFISSFDLNKSDYADLAKLFDDFQDPQEAACIWLKENPSKWNSWVRFPERRLAPFVCGSSKHGHCDDKYVISWLFFALQLGASIMFIAWSITSRRSPKPFPKDLRAKLEHAIANATIGYDMQPRGKSTSGIQSWFLRHAQSYAAGVEFDDEVHDVPCIFKHVRTYENFIRPNFDKSLGFPPAGSNDRWSATLDRSALFPYLFFSNGDGMKPVMLNCVALGFFSGAMSTFFFLVVRWETYKFDAIAWENGIATKMEGTLMTTIDSSSGQIDTLIGAFVLLPSFLLLGYLGYAVSRWREFQNLSYWISGTMNSVALLVGSSTTDGGQSEDFKQLAFRVYRYIQVTHIFNYKCLHFNPWFEALTLEDLVKLGLLTPHEVKVLEHENCFDRMHEIVNSWVGMELYDGTCKDGILHRRLTCEIVTKVRAWIGTFHANFLVGQPNLWSGMMKFVCDILIGMFVLGNPITSFLYENAYCQWSVVLFTCLAVMPYISVSTIVTCLNNPYTSSHDMFNPDMVIAWGERTHFQNLRCSFNEVQAQRPSNLRKRKQIRASGDGKGADKGVGVKSTGNIPETPSHKKFNGMDIHGNISQSPTAHRHDLAVVISSPAHSNVPRLSERAIAPPAPHGAAQGAHIDLHDSHGFA